MKLEEHFILDHAITRGRGDDDGDHRRPRRPGPRREHLECSNGCNVRGGEKLTLTANVSGDAGDSIDYRWTAGRGSFNHYDRRSVEWTAPYENGSIEIRVLVDAEDGRSAEASTDATVTHDEATTLAVDADCIGRCSVETGKTLDLYLLVDDYHDRVLDVAWSASAGSFDYPDEWNVTYTAPASPQTVEVTVRVEDVNDGSTGKAELDIEVDAGTHGGAERLRAHARGHRDHHRRARQRRAGTRRRRS